jgi:DNA (cytosine-5)-methyltransferase 1|nr:DNA cytosine methyltransferase [Ruminococcus bromii]
MPVYAVDLFCGIGGLTKGLELSGINVLYGIDFEKNCKFAYEYNTNSRFINDDIHNITNSQVVAMYPKNAIKILAGCAPCQPFSKYSLRYQKDGYKDEKWKLLYEFSRIVSGVKPEIIAMENVPELSHKNVFIDFVNQLKELGYYTFYKIVNCKYYGVPQNRKRLVLLASTYGEITLIPHTHHEGTFLTVRDAIGKLPAINAGETCENDPLHTATKLSKLNLERIRYSKPGGTWRDWPENLQLSCHKKSSGKSYPSVYGRMIWDEPSPTITTQFYGYGNGRFGHPEQNRAISLREGALLQSFPKNYTFIKKDNAYNKRTIGIQIGNAVPVELGKAIGQSIVNHLEVYKNEKK